MRHCYIRVLPCNQKSKEIYSITAGGDRTNTSLAVDIAANRLLKLSTLDM